MDELVTPGAIVLPGSDERHTLTREELGRLAAITRAPTCEADRTLDAKLVWAIEEGEDVELTDEEADRLTATLGTLTGTHTAGMTDLLRGLTLLDVRRGRITMRDDGPTPEVP